MVWREHTSAHRRSEERDLRLFNELQKLILGPGPGSALPYDQQRSLGLSEDVQGILDLLGLSEWPGGLWRWCGNGDFGVIHRARNHLRRQVEVDGPWPSGDCLAQRDVDESRYSLDGLSSVGPLAKWFGGLHLRQFLEVAHVSAAELSRAPDHQQWPAVDLGVGYSCQSVGLSYTRGSYAHSNSPREVRVSLCCHCRRLLMADRDHSETGLMRNR